MKRLNSLRSFLLLLTLFASAAIISAQDNKPVDGKTESIQRPVANRQPDIRTAALRQLGLSPDQAQQMRRLNVQRRPLMEEAQRRLREANRSLDEVIYADSANDADVQARLKDFQLAQAEVAKIRFMKEFAVRRILNPEQLVRFREMRQRFERDRVNAENRDPNRRSPPNTLDPNRDRPRPIRNLLKQNIKKRNF